MRGNIDLERSLLLMHPGRLHPTPAAGTTCSSEGITGIQGINDNGSVW